MDPGVVIADSESAILLGFVVGRAVVEGDGAAVCERANAFVGPVTHVVFRYVYPGGDFPEIRGLRTYVGRGQVCSEVVLDSKARCKLRLPA